MLSVCGKVTDEDIAGFRAVSVRGNTPHLEGNMSQLHSFAPMLISLSVQEELGRDIRMRYHWRV